MIERFLFRWQAGLFFVSIFALCAPSAAVARGDELLHYQVVPANNHAPLEAKGNIKLEEMKGGEGD